MESANLYQQDHQLQLQLQQQQQQQQQQLVYSSLASSSSPPRVSTIHDQWNPGILLDGDEFSRYMNDILPNSKEYFWPKNINIVPSVKSLIHEVEDTKSCDYGSYEHPLANKQQSENNNKGRVPDCFHKLTDMNCSILKNNYIKNGQQDVIDLNENHWVGSFSNGETNHKLSVNETYSNGETFARFAGLDQPPNYLSSCSQSSYQQNPYASTSLLPTTSPSPPLATEIQNCKNFEEVRHARSFEGRTSSGYCHVQQSGDSPSNSSNKTSTFRKQVSRTKTPKSMPSHEVAKKPRVLPQSPCPTIKVRKEKLGDRIAALHRLVSPFGKTDTASVLTEAIGYIQFLQDQIQSLSMSYLKSSRSKSCRTSRGGLLSMKELSDQEQQPIQDLESRGLCLVPLAFTSYVCSYNGSF